jgi:hypothetical protein
MLMTSEFQSSVYHWTKRRHLPCGIGNKFGEGIQFLTLCIGGYGFAFYSSWDYIYRLKFSPLWRSGSPTHLARSKPAKLLVIWSIRPDFHQNFFIG